VFAGAAREAVFSRPEVIRCIKAGFVPVALKAALVNNPPNDEEGRLYREIARSKIAPQGIGVVNSAGKVLDWVMMFDDDRSVLAFLDHAGKRFAKYPNASKPVAAERYMKFPSMKLADVEDNGKALMVLEGHPKGKRCPATPPFQRGTVVARVFGRALDKDGKPMADTLRQEHYVEDRFHISVGAQKALAEDLAEAGGKRFPLADNLARLLVSHAYLGQLDVNPVGAPGGKGNLKQCKFWAQKVSGEGKGPVPLRIEGRSEAVGASRDGEGGDGRRWQHEVKLVWSGLIEMRDGRVTRLLLLARGSEKLRWGNKSEVVKGLADVARLPAGRPFDLACQVRYGLVGEPIADQDAVEGPVEGLPIVITEVPEEARRQLIDALGPPFLVFRARAQEELKLSEEQKKKLEERLRDTIQQTMKHFEKINDLRPREREKAHHAYRLKANEKLATFLTKNLKDDQRKRLRQLELQHEGLWAMFGQPKLQHELKITDAQRKQFTAIIQDMEKKIRAMLKKAEAGGDGEAIRRQVMKVRKEHEGKIEAILSAAQKKQWQAMLGKPFAWKD
jgi:hypothetical protein